MPWKSSRFWRKTVVFTSRSRLVPAASRIALRLAKTRSVCSSIVPASIAWSPGLSASWPETKTKPPAAIAWEYGAPWKGAGAASVRTTDFSLTAGSLSLAGLGQGGAERLEDRLEHVPAVGAVEEADVQDEARAVGEQLEEAPRDVGAEAADARLRQVDV